MNATPNQNATPKLPLWKHLVFSAILIFGIPLLLILAVELAGRAVVSWKYGVAGKSYGLWSYDKELGAIHAANGYNSNSETNNMGFRNRQNVIEPKPAGALRVIAYGGSTTFCYNLPTDLAWPIRLEQALRKTHSLNDQVLNGGAIMWSIGHELARAKRDLPKLKPDVVLIYSGVNEEPNATMLGQEGVKLDEAVAKGQFGLFTRANDQGRWLKRNSVIVRYWEYVGAGLFASATGKGGGEGPEPVATPASPGESLEPIPVVAQNFTGTLQAFIELIRQHGGKPVYVVMGGIHEQGVNKRLLSYSRIGEKKARDMGVQVIDSNDVVKAYTGNKADLFASSGVHWSEQGAALLAQYIHDKAFR